LHVYIWLVFKVILSFSFRKYRYHIVFLLSAVAILVACSTEKNTFINRTYHSTTAKYNGYFNAKELLRIGLRDYRRTYKEDFYNILPIDLLPNSEDVVDMFPVLDTAISKCKNVIAKHSMPTASKPAKKKTEYAKWIDENWVLIGKANFYRRDFQSALENFEFVRKFYTNRSSMYVGILWKAKCQIELGELANAKRTIQHLDNNLSAYLDQQKSGGKSKKKEKSGDELPPFPKHLHVEIYKTKAQIALIDKEVDIAINHLKDAVKKSTIKEEKARLNFIIGQLLMKKGDDSAKDYFAATLKSNPPFEMGFHSKINKITIGNDNPNSIIKELNKMALEQKYMEFRDQVYFAMARVELNRNDVAQAKTYLSSSVRYSINNPRQKGISYEKLGDLSFNERNYVYAQKYFDSSARVIPDDYVNAELIRSKAENLSKLVENIEVIQFEDSVQRIAMMSEKDREKYLKDVIKKLQEEERLKKEREAQRAEELRQLQQTLASQGQGDGNKWYWNNPKMVNEGANEFKRLWGSRENEDDWRRSNKMMVVSFDEPDEDDTTRVAETKPKKSSVDELTAEMLMENLPLTEEAMRASNDRLDGSIVQLGYHLCSAAERAKNGE
jgi:hypothetical protein